MIDLATIQDYFASETVFVTEHAVDRFKQRGIYLRDVRAAVYSGDIIEQYPDDFPFPSCLICCVTRDNRTLHVVMSDGGRAEKCLNFAASICERLRPS